MLKGLLTGLLTAAAKMFHRIRRVGNPLPEGVTLRSVLLHETLIFYCMTCGVQHRRPSHSSGVMVAVRRADGQLYTLPDDVSSTNCLHCHNLTRLPLLYTNKQTAQQLARTIDPTADYEFMRIEPRKK